VLKAQWRISVGWRRGNAAGSLRRVTLLAVAALVSLGTTEDASFAQAPSLAELVERIRPAVALVTIYGGAGRSSGSAFVISPDGLLVTALHVVEEATHISVTFVGRSSLYAEVVAADPESDLAILRVPQTGLTALPLRRELPRLGEEVLVVGYPLAALLGQTDVTVTRGIVSALRPELGAIQVDAAMNPGVSGGPVITLQGEVVGVAVAALRGTQQVNFAVPSTLARGLLERLGNRSADALVPLRGPFLAVQEVTVGLRRGFPASSSRTELGAECVSPPRYARRIVGVRGALRIGDVLAVVWLSLGRGADINAAESFAHLSADGAWLPPRVPMRTELALRGLDLPPERVCVNATYQGSLLICFSCQFEARYGVEYRVVRVPGY
jgi:S1-C subfamily serine protease